MAEPTEADELTPMGHVVRPGVADAEADAPALDALVSSGNYRGLAAVLPYLDLSREQRTAVRALCTYASSIVDMDAEDWLNLGGVPADLLQVVHAAHMPQRPDEPARGGLASLVPTYGLFLEALGARWRNHDLLGVLAVVHLMGEYLPLLAWESVLGHAADPRLLPRDVGGEGSRWGLDIHTEEGRMCDHSPSIRGSLRTAARVGFPERNGGSEQAARAWLAYLDRDHSRVSGALAQCGTHPDEGRPSVGRECRTPCSVWLRHEPDQRADLADRLSLAAAYVDGPLVALRHAAPVGHGFGVPDTTEIQGAWQETWAALTRGWSERVNPMEGLVVPASPAEPLGGLSLFLTHVAGRPVATLGVLSRVDGLIAGLVQT